MAIVTTIIVILILIATYFILKKRGFRLHVKLHKALLIEKDCLEFELEYPDGTRLYFVKPECIMMIHSERNRVIDEYLSYISWLGVELSVLIAGMNNIDKETDNIALKPYESESLTSRDNVHKITNSIRNNVPDQMNKSKEFQEKIFCLFGVLDGEDFRTVNAEYDRKKIELLNKYPEYKHFFFQKLEIITKDLGLTYKSAIQIATETLMIKEKVAEILKESILLNTKKD